MKNQELNSVFKEYGVNSLSELIQPYREIPFKLKVLQTLGHRFGLPCGKREARSHYWKKRLKMSGESGMIDSRPARDLIKSGATLGEIVVAYQIARDRELWERGYWSPRSINAHTVLWLVRQPRQRRDKITREDLLEIQQCYGDNRRHSRDALRISHVVNWLNRSQLPVSAGIIFTLAKAVIRQTGEIRRKWKWAALGVINRLAEQDKIDRHDVWPILIEELKKPTRNLIAACGSPRQKWGLLYGIKVAKNTTVPPSQGGSGRAYRKLLEMSFPDFQQKLDNSILFPIVELEKVFGSQAPVFAEAIGKTIHNTAQAVHDAGQLSSNEHAKLAGQFILSHRRVWEKEIEKTWQDILRLISRFEPGWEKLSWHDAVQKAREVEFPPGLAFLAETEMSFEQALEYQKWLQEHPGKNTKSGWIPDVEVRGEEVELSGDWLFSLLPHTDPRGPILGLYTNCCQHPAGAGKDCAMHGWQSPFGGFYIVRYKGRIVAQSWAWRGGSKLEDGAICFDNIEVLGEAYAEGILKLYQLAAKKMLAVDRNLQRITVGTGYDDAGVKDLQDCDPAFPPYDYSSCGYRDSHRQKLLAKRDSPKYKQKLDDLQAYFSSCRGGLNAPQ